MSFGEWCWTTRWWVCSIDAVISILILLGNTGSHTRSGSSKQQNLTTFPSKDLTACSRLINERDRIYLYLWRSGFTKPLRVEQVLQEPNSNANPIRVAYVSCLHKNQSLRSSPRIFEDVSFGIRPPQVSTRASLLRSQNEFDLLESNSSSTQYPDQI